jgi:hypothetical protein
LGRPSFAGGFAPGLCLRLGYLGTLAWLRRGLVLGLRVAGVRGAMRRGRVAGASSGRG